MKNPSRGVPVVLDTDLPTLDQRAICECFNSVFADSHQVQLRGGGAEPDYLPPRAGAPAQLVARQDFAASALHEVAHWCVAGARRRLLPDYGYRYVPPPRGELGQAQFFALERRVQAVELLFSQIAGVRFVASADDPDFALTELWRFEQQVRAQVAGWQQGTSQDAPPPRATQFACALARHRTALPETAAHE